VLRSISGLWKYLDELSVRRINFNCLYGQNSKLYYINFVFPESVMLYCIAAR
jgi:hypothetical protein